MDRTSGYVLRPRLYTGDTVPPDALEDMSRFRNNGTFTNTPVWARQISGIWTLGFVGASSQRVTHGNCRIARTLFFWVNLSTTTQSILEETAAVGIVVAAGTIAYASWDNCYVNAVDTNTIAIGWRFVAIVSTTDVIVSAFRLGLVNVTYFTGALWNVRLTRQELTADQIYSIYQSERGWLGV